jgi:hypothetical protein
LHRSLVSLDLRLTDLGDQAVGWIADGIEESWRRADDPRAASLHILRLGGNHITDVGAIRLASLIRANKSLQVLGLSANRIGDAGAVALFEALDAQPVFVRLFLAGNNVRVGAWARVGVWAPVGACGRAASLCPSLCPFLSVHLRRHPPSPPTLRAVRMRAHATLMCHHPPFPPITLARGA